MAAVQPVVLEEGAEYSDYESLSLALRTWENENYVNVYVRCSRTIQAAKKRAPKRQFKPKLQYYELVYACIHGGRKSTSKSRGKRPNQSSFITDCPFLIRVGASGDGEKLVVKSMRDSHNHEISKKTFDFLPKQRRLTAAQCSQVGEMLKMKVSKKLIQQHIHSQTGKRVIIKDLHNLKRKLTQHGGSDGNDVNDLIGEMNKGNVETSKHGSVFLIGINRPLEKNTVNQATAHQLIGAFQTFEADTEASVAVLHGQGDIFCAGYDLKELAKMNSKNTIPYAPMGPSKTVFSKPVICAISGYAVAGGLELALMCDMRVAEENAVLGVFCRQFGVPLIDGGTVRLPHLIGLPRALDLILTGRLVQADEALTIGLVNRVVPVGHAITEAVKLANEIASFPRECMLADRKSALYATYEAKSLQDALQFEHDNGNTVIDSEAIKGAKTFTAEGL